MKMGVSFLTRFGFAAALMTASVLGHEAMAQEAQTVVVVASDFAAVKGLQPAIKTLTSDGKLVGFNYAGVNFPLKTVDASGVVLWQVRALGNDYRVFKLRKGWPANSVSKDENPKMDTSKNELGEEGGFITLSYLEEGGIFSNDYRHLRMKVQCESSGKCRLLTADGKPFDRVFAFASENQRGIRDVKPVTRSEFARLTGEITVEGGPHVSTASDKGMLGASPQGPADEAAAGSSSRAN